MQLTDPLFKFFLLGALAFTTSASPMPSPDDEPGISSSTWQKDRLQIWRYSDLNCGEKGGIGDEVGKHVHLTKYKCKTLDEPSFSSFKFELPDNKAFNHCSVTVFNVEDCEGPPVTIVPELIKAEDMCSPVYQGKSIYVGPCN